MRKIGLVPLTALERKYKYRAAHPMANIESARKYAAAHPDRVAANRRKYRAANKTAVLAHLAIQRAVQKGVLAPEPCFICGDCGKAHHASYAPEMRLAVTWLCKKHHKQLHTEVRSCL